MPAGTHLVTFRELSAVATDVPPGKRPGPPDTALHRSVIAAVFAHHSIVPLPPGVVFRRSDTLVNWLELHYAALHDALQYVEGRAEARLHVRPAGTPGRKAPPAGAAEAAYSQLSASALDIFRTLGRDVAAWIVVPRKTAGPPGVMEPRPTSSPTDAAGPGSGDGVADRGDRHPGRDFGPGTDGGRDVADISASFLLERSHWREFAEAVAGQARRSSALDLTLTGPWPPYDFVRLQFGG